MRFVTGLYSERLNDLEARLADAIQTQRTKREAVAQIRQFMAQFELASETEFRARRESLRRELDAALKERGDLERTHKTTTHALDPIRAELRKLSQESGELESTIETLELRIQQQQSLRSELITSKVKAARGGTATTLLLNVEFAACPRCGARIDSNRFQDSDLCCLCGNRPPEASAKALLAEPGKLDRELDVRIDDLAESIGRHQREQTRHRKRLQLLKERRADLDRQLARELDRYDAAYISRVREAERKVATLRERVESLDRMAQMPSAIANLEREAGSLQGAIDNLRLEQDEERQRLQGADVNIKAIADAFKETMLAMGFPGVYTEDRIRLDPRNWFPYVIHGEQEWSYADAGSGGKKMLFNVCYALAVHKVARQRNLPLPTFLIVDSPTKNITRDENPELVEALYKRIYPTAAAAAGQMQFILIDSHLIRPTEELIGFKDQRMAIETDSSPLFSTYRGP